VLIVLVYLVAAEVVKRYIYNRMEQVPMLLVKPN